MLTDDDQSHLRRPVHRDLQGHRRAGARASKPSSESTSATSARGRPVDAGVTSTRCRGVDGGRGRQSRCDVPYAQIVDADGNAIGKPGRGRPRSGSSWIDDPDLNPFTSRARQPAARRRRRDRHRQGHRRTKGDLARRRPCRVLTGQATEGVQDRRDRASSGPPTAALGASVVLFTLAEAQRIVGYTPDQFASIGVVGRPGRVAGGAPQHASRTSTRGRQRRGGHRRRAHEGESGRRRQVPQHLQLASCSCSRSSRSFVVVLHHLQHVHDRRGAADAGDGAAPRRSAPRRRQVTAVDPRRIGRRRCRRVRLGISASASCSRAGSRRCSTPIGIDIPASRHRDPDHGGRRVVLSSARRSPSSPRSCPRGRRRAFHRSRRSRDVAIERRKGFGPRTAIGLVITLGSVAP